MYICDYHFYTYYFPLKRTLHHDPSITITVGAVGVIPYYSRLKTVDWFGLNDKWVAWYGDFTGYRPGH
jgi:hypothetical protein